MKKLEKQRGATTWEMCLYIFVFLAVVTTALKLGPLYIQDRNIGSALNALNDSLEGDVADDAIKSALSKTFQVSMIDATLLNNLEVDRTGVTPELKLDYEVRTPFVANVEVIVHFSHSVKLTAAR